MKIHKFIRSVAISSVLLASVGAFAQNGMKDIKGVIYDDKGEPVIGASVVVQGTSNGTISDLDGNFTLSVPEGSVIEISFVGF